MLYQKLISSHSTWAKVTGAVLKKGWLLIPLAASVALTALNIPEGWQRVWGFVSLSLFAAIMISACNTLTDIFTLLRRESHITRCQIWILIAIGIWLVGAIIILDIQKDSKYGLVFGLVGSVLAWIFQDKIKGAAAFLHIRSHKLIKIGDWIQLPGKGVDGEVKKVTLTTVTLCNWDTTTSTIPISALQQDHFINLQNMAEGKTYGRQMVKNFILDTSCVRPLTEEEAARLRAGEAGRYSRALGTFQYRVLGNAAGARLVSDRWKNRSTARNGLSNVICSDCFESRELAIRRQCSNYDKLSRESRAALWEKNSHALSVSEHCRWTTEKLILGFRAFGLDERCRYESLFGSARASFCRQAKNAAESPSHVDICSYRHLRLTDPASLKYDTFLMLAIPLILEKLK